MRYARDDHYRRAQALIVCLILVVLAISGSLMVMAFFDAASDGRCISKPKTRLGLFVMNTAPFKLGCWLGEKP